MRDAAAEHHFDRLTAALDPPVILVTVAAGDERDGCLVGFHSQSGIHPRRYAVWLSKKNRTFRLASGASHLGVHLLSDSQHDLAVLFGGETGDELDKLARCAWSAGPGGVPLLEDAEHRFVGRIVAVHDLDCDHSCAVLEPTTAQCSTPLEPLRFHRVTDIDAGHPA